jgi:threonine dehydrogenase-like Zn-dependent dehydrogenase
MMLALEMFRSLPRHAAGRVVGGRMPGVLSGFAAPLRLVTIDEPRVERPGWARLRTRLSGICGSDLGALSGRTSLYFSAVVSMPFVPGHEVVAELVDDCEDLPAGTRVVVDPVLTCAARGVEPCEACATGATNRCSRITVGHLAPGLQTGFCKDTGGGWGEQLVAHRNQLHVVPEGQRAGPRQRRGIGRPVRHPRPAKPDSRR